MDLAAAKMIGAGLAMTAGLGAGIGLGNIFNGIVSGIARNPEAKDEIFKAGLIGAALTEAVMLFALGTAMTMMFAF
ncbi:MAG: F0F1 ATP synthase subunit C [Proteobacteria bacterium]|jgi:F-type H+-transporting ATPase subunit c|nr:F0F1 ATP synthase subunit C [Pseudomonadota bacterium]